MRKVLLVLAASAALVFSGSLFAQNWNAEPLYGTLNLTTGFTPDPQVVQIQAGGSVAVSSLGITDSTGGICTGYINAERPDVRVNYTAGTTFPLRLYVVSAVDTTLLVNLPDTTWRCNDDYSGLNPLVHIPNPQSGQYNVWVGVWGSSGVQPATFYVTELTSNQP